MQTAGFMNNDPSNAVSKHAGIEDGRFEMYQHIKRKKVHHFQHEINSRKIVIAPHSTYCVLCIDYSSNRNDTGV